MKQDNVVPLRRAGASPPFSTDEEIYYDTLFGLIQSWTSELLDRHKAGEPLAIEELMHILTCIEDVAASGRADIAAVHQAKMDVFARLFPEARRAGPLT